MKRIISIVMGLLLFFSIGIQAQTSVAQTVDLSVLYPPIGWPVSYTSPYFRWDNRTGSLIYGLDVDMDSLAVVTKEKETYYILTVTAIDTISIVEGSDTLDINDPLNRGKVTLSVRTFIGDRSAGTRTVTVRAPRGHYVDAVTVLPGLTLRFAFSRSIAVGDVSYFYYLKHELLFSRSGAAAFFSNPPAPDSSVIVLHDTTTVGDTTYSAAFAGQYGFNTIVLKAGSLFHSEFGYQVKENGGDWSTRLDTLGGPNWFMLIDSTSVASGATASCMIPATMLDSMRIVILNKQTSGNQIIDYLKIYRRD